MRIFPNKRFAVDAPHVPSNQRDATRETARVVDRFPVHNRRYDGIYNLPKSRPYTYADAIATAEWLNEAHDDGRIE